MKVVTTALLLAEAVSAFPWVPQVPGVDSSMLVERQQPGTGPGSEATCPFNARHVNAAPISAKYPYNGAVNGTKGKGMHPHPLSMTCIWLIVAQNAEDIECLQSVIAIIDILHQPLQTFVDHALAVRPTPICIRVISAD